MRLLKILKEINKLKQNGTSALTNLNLIICDIELIAKPLKPKGYPIKAKSLGDFLKRKRLNEKLSVKKVCTDLGILSSTLHRWENNKTKLRIESKYKIIEYLGFNPIINKNI